MADWPDQFRGRCSYQELWKIFNCPARVAALIAASGPRLCVGDLADRLGFTRPRLSQHLGTLKWNGFVRLESEGKLHFYRLTGAASVRCSRLGIDLGLRASDDAEIALKVLSTAPAMNHLGRAYHLVLQHMESTAQAPPPPVSPQPPIIKVRRARRLNGSRASQGSDASA